MIQLKHLTVNTRWLEEEQKFFIWTTNNQQLPIVVPNFFRWLCTWHESSFYGTILTHASVDGRNGIILSPWMALEFFAKIPENPLVSFYWCEISQLYRDTAPILFHALKNGEFQPDFTIWKQGSWGWKLTNDIEKQLPEQHLPFLQKWFSAALNEWKDQDPELAEAWEEITSLYPLVNGGEANLLVIDEQDWLEKIGWRVDETPFTVGLRLTEPEEGEDLWKLETILRVKETGELIQIDYMPKKWHRFTSRIDRERNIWSQLVPWLKEKNYLSEYEAWEFLTEASETLVNAGVEILLPSWWQAIKDAQLAVKAKVKSSSNFGRSFVGLNALIDFDWRFSTGGVEISEEEFMALVQQKRRLVNIRGRWIKLDPELIKQVQAILKKANKEGLHFRDVLEQELLQQEISDVTDDDVRPFSYVQIELNRQLKNMVRKLTEIKEIPEMDVPAAFQGSLRPYQKKGFEWLMFMRRFGFGACLADDMGLGKTVQMMAYFLKLKEQDDTGAPSLIICPTSVLGNWQKEFEKFAPSLRVHLHYGPNRAKDEKFLDSIAGTDIVLTSYGLAHLDFEELSSVKWNTICLDEAQNIKNAHTKQSRAIRRLRGNHHIALTGTPMENRLTELWAIFDFINPGYLGSLGSFTKRFVTPIEKEHDEEKIVQVQRLVRPFLLRRTKRDPEVELNLPDKQEQKEYCPLTVEQASLYEQLVQDTFMQLEQVTGMQRKGLILKMLGKLKQLCDHPSLYLKEEKPKDVLNRSHKMMKLLELVENIRAQGESCLIFTQYIEMGEMIRRELEQHLGELVLFLNGSVPKAERDRMIAEFQEGKHHIFILSLKAGGTGLNLTAANHVIHYDRWWNPAVENQATDRAYRIGQKRFVHVHKFISTGTVEEKIDEMLEKKQALNEEIIQSEHWITELPTEDLKELFALTVNV
jgi:SNF2 family DNA or RNA helicase